MSGPAISEQDEQKYMVVMAGYDAAMLAHESRNPVPMCHFQAMTQNWDDSHPSSDNAWYECEHCGHTEDSATAWAKVRARARLKSLPGNVEAIKPKSANAAI